MPINAVCPECQNRFQLQDDLLGQSMRCPKCRTIFTVTNVAQVPTLPATRAEPLPPVDTTPRPRTDPPPSQSRSGNLSDFVPVLSSGAVPTATPPFSPPREVKWSEIDQKSAVPPTTPKPKTGVVEKAWSPEMDGPAKKTHVVSDSEPAAQHESNARTERRKRGRRLLAGLIVFVVVGLSAGGYFLYRYISLGPERTLAAAHGLYKEARYDQARKIFERLLRDYPNDNRVPEATFFAEVSAVRHESSSVMNRSDPGPAVKQWKQLMGALNDPAIAAFADKKRFGIDIAEAGTKLVEDLLGKAKDVFDRDKPEAAQQWLDEATAVDLAVDRYRPEEAGKPESIAKEFITLRKQVDEAKAQLALLDEAKKLLVDPDDDKIVQAKRFAAARGLASDDRFNNLLDQAEKQIQGKAVYSKQEPPVKPTAIPDDGLTSLLFAPSLTRGARPPLQGPPNVFFALARGVLYALSEVDGNVLWAARTGIDCNITPVRVPASDQNPELVLVASSLGGQHGLTARSPNDGRPLWHQTLPAECKGPPVVFGAEAYVALNDGVGTILQLNVATGELVGKISIGRPLGTSMGLRPQSGLLYVPAEARAVYVFDLDKRGPNAERLEPAFLGVMATGHGPGTLRAAPVFANPDPEASGPKYLVLSQVDGPDAMKLRVVPMLFSADGMVDNSGTSTEIPVTGWASFAPYCDGEMLAVVTDQGSFGLYGLSLAGNRDAAIFHFPQQQGRPQPPSATARGQIVHAIEGSYWVVARGNLHRFRFGVNGANGVRFVPYGDSVPVGDPLQPAQVTPSGDLLVVVTQDGQTCRATALDANTSEVRWRRELGLVVKGNPLAMGSAALFLDHAGGMYRVDTAKLADRGNAAWLVDERWLVASPASGFSAVTDLIPGPNNTAIAVMYGGSEAQPRYLIRRYNGTSVDDIQVAAPAPLAGNPALSGDCLLLPLANGSLYRVNFADNKGLEEGPTWRGERLSATSRCALAVINPTMCITSDGNKGLKRWSWAPGSRLFELEGRLDKLSEKVVTMERVPGDRAFLLGDMNGTSTLWDAEKFKFPPLRTWRPNAKGPIPVGTLNTGYWLAPTNDALLLYHIASQIVALDPNTNEPRWVSETLQRLVDIPLCTATEVYVTEQKGTVRTLDMTSGKLTAKKFTLPASYSFGSSALPVGAKHLLIPLTDGTILFGEMK